VRQLCVPAAKEAALIATMAALAALRGVFFAEFHAVQGPRIASQAPEGLLSAEVFDSIAEYVIPKPQLCGRLVMVYGGRRVGRLAA